MIDYFQLELILFFALYLAQYLIQGLNLINKINCMALTFKSPPSSISSLSPNLSCVSRFFTPSWGAEVQPNEQMITQESLMLIDDYDCALQLQEPNIVIVEDQGSGTSRTTRVLGEAKKAGGNIKLQSKRPTRLVVPEFLAGDGEEICKKSRKLESKEFEVQGRDFFVAAKKGRRREFMEDGYGVLLDIMGDPKQAFFTVIDGHGGRAATDYVAENLGKNIAERLGHVVDENDYRSEDAIRGGYLVTDKGFLNQGLSSGACAASVLLKDGDLHVANVGDCRVVLCRKGAAHALTKEHRLTREDERLRIENSGGFVHCKNGIWRVQGTLAVSRAIGDQHLKQWVISEPEIKTIPLTSDCEFLIIASDGLWDKVDDQEAVDLVVRENSEVKINACKKLVDMSSSRGNMDDITVMVINLQSFLATKTCQSSS